MKASLGLAPPTKRKTGCHIPRHDVGGGEMLTTREIAARIGGTTHNVRVRLSKGWKGAQLLLPLRERRKVGLPKSQTQVVAYKLALAFGHRKPSIAEIRRIHPMDRSNAAYWRNAILIAQEQVQ